jgi:SHAQKYF class myb-like DNA-binding protein
MTTKTLKRGRVSRQNRSAPYPSASVSLPTPAHPTGTWAAEEHDRFLEAMKLYPKGPWKAIADHVATRSVRQVQTHAQKYQEKVVRRMRGLRKPKRKGEDESDEDIGHRVVMGTFGKLRKRKGDDSEPMASTPTQSQTDMESVRSDSDDESEAESTASSTPRSEISESSMHAKKAKSAIEVESFTSLLEQQAPASPDCIDFAPLCLSELSPGWFYLDELADKTMDLACAKEPMVTEGPSTLPSLGESLDFFIEYLSIVN